jgi:hypothetical protein
MAGCRLLLRAAATRPWRHRRRAVLPGGHCLDSEVVRGELLPRPNDGGTAFASSSGAPAEAGFGQDPIPSAWRLRFPAAGGECVNDGAGISRPMSRSGRCVVEMEGPGARWLVRVSHRNWVYNRRYRPAMPAVRGPPPQADNG